MGKKLKLEKELRVRSFVTELSDADAKELKGGVTNTRTYCSLECTTPDCTITCP